MKKIFMFLCCVLMSNAVWAARSCPETQYLSLQGAQNGKDNEFVYTSRDVYEEVSNCFKNRIEDGKNCNISKGMVYECDAEQGCENNTYLFGQPGWIHSRRSLFGGDRFQDMNDKIAVCTTSPDSWGLYSYSDCPETMDNGWKKITFKNKTNRICYIHSNAGYAGGTYCCKSAERSACESDPYVYAWAQGGCQCLSNQKVENKIIDYVWDRSAWRCIPKEKSNSVNKDCGSTKHGESGTAPCTQILKNGGAMVCQGTCDNSNWKNITIVSCDTNKYKTKPENGKCVKKTQSSNPNPSNNNGGGSQTQSGGNNGGNGTVVTPPAGGNGGVNIEPQQYECPEPVNGYLYWRAQYKDCEDVIAGLNKLEEYCKSGNRTESGYESRIAGLEKLRDQCKEEAARNQRITRSTAIISDASKKLDDIMAGLKISVWKTAEGNFNTARLASDSIAGVVLGTAGGLITSHLVKKGQVKNGFEDVQCTVGGQKVADWGDEFTVGIR